jgi:UDP-N-acetylglucosamine transferase subunit ALG13
MSTFVTTGNGVQSFSRLLDEIKRIAPQLPQPVIVQHGKTAFSADGIQSFDLVDLPTFQKLLNDCKVLITHGGAGSVFGALKIGKKPVVVPRMKKFDEIIDNHQITFAEELQRQGKVVAVHDVSQLLVAVQDVLANPEIPDRAKEYVDPLVMIGATLKKYAPDTVDKICLVTPPGGHLNEILFLSSLFQDHPHFYILNTSIIEPVEMQGRVRVISFSHRDWRFLINIKEAFNILRKEKPKVILTSGGGFSVAFALAGKVVGIPTVYVETCAKVDVPTMTGRAMRHLTRDFFYQWPQVAKHFPKGKYVGLLY